MNTVKGLTNSNSLNLNEVTTIHPNNQNISLKNGDSSIKIGLPSNNTESLKNPSKVNFELTLKNSGESLNNDVRKSVGGTKNFYLSIIKECRQEIGGIRKGIFGTSHFKPKADQLIVEIQKLRTSGDLSAKQNIEELEKGLSKVDKSLGELQGIYSSKNDSSLNKLRIIQNSKGLVSEVREKLEKSKSNLISLEINKSVHAGHLTEDLKSLMKNTDFKPSQNQQETLANSVLTGKLTDDIDVRTIVKLMAEGKITNKVAISNLAEGVKTGVIKDMVSHESIANSIKNGHITNKVDLKNIYEGISSGVITSDNALSNLAKSIKDGVVSDENCSQSLSIGFKSGVMKREGVLSTLEALKAGKIKGEQSLKNISEGIKTGVCDKDCRLIKSGHRNLMNSIKEGMFGSNTETLKNLTQSKYIQSNIDKEIVSSFYLATKNDPEHTILSNLKLTPELVTGLDIETPLLSFGSKYYSVEEAAEAISKELRRRGEGSSILAEHGQYLFNDDHQYALQLTSDNKLLVFDVTTKEDRDDFEKWMSKDYGNGFMNTFDKVKAYGLEARPLSNVSLTGLNLGWTNKAIEDTAFDVNQYKHSETINFVLNDLLLPITSKKDPESKKLSEKMVSMMQQIVKNEGMEKIQFGTNKEDKELKDKINKLCANSASNLSFDNYKEKVDEFLLNKEDVDIAKLGFIFGNMAAQGQLGYEMTDPEFGKMNVSNFMFYKLAEHCYQKLEDSNEIKLPKNFSSELRNGVCIQILSRDVNLKNRTLDIKSVFEKNNV